MPGATFVRVPGLNLYWSNDNTSARPFGFLATDLAEEQLSLAGAWADVAGVFFAVSAPVPADRVKDLHDALMDWLRRENWPVVWPRLLWVELSDDGDGLARVLALIVSHGPSQALTRATTIDFTGYLLNLTAGSTLSPSPEGDAILIDGPGVFCADTSPPPAYPAVGRRVGIAVAGPAAGAAAFAIDLSAGGEDGQPTDFQRLSVGTRFGWRSGDTEVDYLHVPTLRQPAGSCRLWATLQPFGVGTDPQSRLSFLPAAGGAGAGAPVFATDFLTPEGRAVRLTPALGSDAEARPGGLVLARQPLFFSDDPLAPYVHYLAPDGDFTLGVDGLPAPSAQQSRILCGLTALEQVQGASPAALRFQPGPAFSPGPGEELTPLATTAWVAAGGAAGAAYYAQPDAAPFYGTPNGAGYLGLVDIAVASSPQPLPLPLLGYAGLAAGDGTQAAIEVERTMLGPARSTIANLTPETPPVPAPPAWGITTAGLIVGFDPATYRRWAWMGLANIAGVKQPDIAFNDVRLPLQPAVQSAGAFVVLANPAALLNGPATIPYQLTADALARLRTSGLPCFKDFTDWDELGALSGPYPTEDAFINAIRGLRTPLTPSQADAVLRVSGVLRAGIDGWTFDLAPRTWPPRPADETRDNVAETRQGVMMIKMDRTLPLEAWIERLAASSWPGGAAMPGHTVEATAEVLRDSLALARERRAASADPATSPYAHFLDVVAAEPTWTGTLMLNAAVPTDQLPQDLQAIQAGIRSELFYAHHIGFEHGLIGVDGADLSLSPDRVFGAIDYHDPQDLRLDPGSAEDFQFKVQQLTVGFAGSRVSSFTGRVELFVNRMFGATTRKYPSTSGNNIVLNGVKVLEAGEDGVVRTGYRFLSDDANVYQLAGSALQTVSVAHTALTQNRSLSSADAVVTDFALGGGLMFQPTSGFDMFGYGPKPAPLRSRIYRAEGAAAGARLDQWVDTPHGRARRLGSALRHPPEELAREQARRRLEERARRAAAEASPSTSALAFSNLIVRMTFRPSTNSTSFALLTNDATFDLPASQPRPDGLAARMFAAPGRFVKASAESGSTPQDLGYMPVACGAKQAKLAGSWYGVEFALELGALGALSGDTPVTLYVLAAWAVDAAADTPPIFLGVRLPGSGVDGFELALQGVVKLGFAAFQFDTYPAPDGGLGYLLRLRDFGLTLLGKRFPSGHLNVLITAAPDASGEGKLGWFAGYVPETSPISASARRLGRRHLATRAVAPAGGSSDAR